MKLPDQPRKGEAVYDTVTDIINYLRAYRVVGVSGGRVETTSNGTSLVIDKPIPEEIEGGTTEICPFGEIITWTEGEGESAVSKTGIRGGVMYCGPSNWNIAPYEIDLETNGVWLVSLPVDVVVNRDDDNEIILPGILSGTKPEQADWELTDNTSGTADYPENEQPEVADGAGKIYVPIGQLTVEGGTASLAPVACGNITIGQCGAVLSHERG